MAKEKPTPNQQLRYERIRRGWSQQELADEIGTTPINIGRWERGVTLPGPHFRRKLCVVFEKTAQELGLLQETTATYTATEVPPQTPTSALAQNTPRPLWNVPYNRNLLFTGREDILTQLHNAFMQGQYPVALAQPQAISGLGGIGKTQTAIEYAYRYRDSYDSILWARADSTDLLISDFLLIAALLNLPQRNEQDQSIVIKAVVHWFDTHERWLLIMDNADQLELVHKFIPSAGKGHVLLTTRANSTGTMAQHVELDTMGLEEGTLFLLRRAKLLKGNTLSLQSASNTIRGQAQAIVETVGGLPLALDQAGAYIEETGCNLSDYLKFYKSRRKRLLRTRGHNASGHPEPIATTWSLSFEKVERANAVAAELLRLCAFLHPDEIPEAMIIEGGTELGPVLQSAVEDELELNEAIVELRRYSLMKRDPEKKILNIHRLVQAVIKDGMEEVIQRGWAEQVVKMVNRAFPVVQFAHWPTCQQYLPHVQSCVDLIKQWDMHNAEAAQLLHRTGNYLYERAQYKEAELLLQKALAIHEQILGPEHVDVATDMNDLAGLYVDMGKYAQAEKLYLQARSIREGVLGSIHPDVASTINGLGLLYREQGWFAQAKPLFEQALAIRKTLGTENSDLAGSYNNLALILSDQGKYTNVDILYKQALAIWERVLGPDHPEVATSLNNIGWHYYRQGRYDLVEALHLRALAIREKGLGADHPHVAMSLNALGLLYRDQGNYAKAESFLQRALIIREQANGPDHLDVGQSVQNIGVLYYLQGKYEQAESLLLRSLRIREQTGPDSPLVAYSLNALAILYRDQGRHVEAEKLFQRTLTIREQNLGKDSVDVSYTLAEFAVLYRDQGKYDQAELLFQQAIEIQEKMLEPEHPKGLSTSMAWLCFTVFKVDMPRRSHSFSAHSLFGSRAGDRIQPILP